MTKRTGAGLLAAGLVCIGLLPARAEVDAASSDRSPLRQLSLAVHVHSSMSTGDLPPEPLMRRAADAGLDGVILTDNYELGVEYGLWPLRGLLRYRAGIPSVREEGLADFFDAVRRAQARDPERLIIPGLEVTPHYYWTGSLWRNTLALHDTQKNLLVVGLDEAGMMRALTPPPTRSMAGRMLPWWPVALLAPAGWLWRRERVVAARTKFFQLSRRRRYRGEAIAVLALGGLLLADNLLLAGGPDRYRPDPDHAAVQGLIERAAAAGAVTIWSLPEAADFHRYQLDAIGRELAERGGAAGLFGRPLSRLPWSITVQTDPYPDALARTAGYTAFGAIYQDHVRITEPGGGWDRLLLAYLDGWRSAPAWGVGELAYHQAGLGGKRLGDVQTVVLARERSAPAVLASLRAGAFYARQRVPEWGLVLDDFSLTLAGIDVDQPAISGDTLTVAPGAPIAVRVAVSATDARAETVTVKVVRAGRVWREFSAVTPFERQWEDDAPQSGRLYYRIEIGEGDQHLLSNPIFVSVREH
ncbi:MAG: PHP domain-containing protein [Nitrospirota bacterium]